MLKFYGNPDGGFMKHHQESTISPLDINLGMCYKLVSDLNATHLAIDSREALYDLLGLDVPAIPAQNRFW